MLEAWTIAIAVSLTGVVVASILRLIAWKNGSETLRGASSVVARISIPLLLGFVLISVVLFRFD